MFWEIFVTIMIVCGLMAFVCACLGLTRLD